MYEIVYEIPYKILYLTWGMQSYMFCLYLRMLEHQQYVHIFGKKWNRDTKYVNFD